MVIKFAPAFLAVGISSCALLQPAVTVRFSKVAGNFELGTGDTNKTVIHLNSQIYLDFDLSGSDRISIHPGVTQLLADGISPGWYYADFIGADMWVRGVPVYLSGEDKLSVEVANNQLVIDGRAFFGAQTQKSTAYPFLPSLSLTCNGCTSRPQLKFDGQVVDYVPPWVSVAAGWHSVEIYSPFDRVELYYRALFDNYSVTEFDLYPVKVN
ncbi:MAG TPA: hypothetical protein VIS48_07215 [Candidatus Kryptonia bacterium]